MANSTTGTEEEKTIALQALSFINEQCTADPSFAKIFNYSFSRGMIPPELLDGPDHPAPGLTYDALLDFLLQV